ncbi:hypothetical protein EJK80_01290 [Corynebacterium phoceense]|uniref:DUF3558 domain-containing protein n=1 Tax=Corynebacterium phoceense TaxID=1686286 RepID=A0A540RAW6_9CORY|nr:hypothetical protein [Corynebacterium phoceense]TQE44737.1 hypothetical protein EJK80_01290 [Corynebacterium phoceense]
MLRPLHNVACLGIVAAFLAGCTVSDAEPQPAVGTAAAASPASPAPDTADDEAREDQASIDLGGWAMPEPGPFDLATYQANPFEPCKEIPEVVLQRAGLIKKENPLGHLTPFPCELLPLHQDLEGALLTINAWQGNPLNLAESAGQFVDGRGNPSMPEIVVLRPVDPAMKQVCEAAVETPRGTISVTYAFVTAPGHGSEQCRMPEKILSSLYAKELDDAA